MNVRKKSTGSYISFVFTFAFVCFMTAVIISGVSAAPTFTSITPDFGPTAGGTAVAIVGTDFNVGLNNVTIGGAPATSVIRVDATHLTAVTPAGTTGPVDVVITNTTDLSSVTAPAAFFYADPPTFTSITPSSGPTTGGTAVTIIGTNFIDNGLPSSGVSIGGIFDPAAVIVDPTHITLTTSAHAAGAVYVNISVAGGSVNQSNAYTYGAVPTFVSIAPTSGRVTGVTNVTITGTNFAGATGVTFGGTAATNVSVFSSTIINVTTPAHAAGAVDVIVTTPNGTPTGTGAYTYGAGPTFVSIAPTSGPVTGVTNVTITGTNFAGATGVTFGGTAATNVSVFSSTIINATTPAHAAGAVDVIVTTPNGTPTGTGAYTYGAVPTFVSIAPTSGPVTGITNVTITGTNFAGTTSVTFGGTAATNVSVFSSTIINATTPAHAAGAVDVVVTTPNGTPTGTAVYTYGAVPTFVSIAPTSGPITGITNVTITGTNLIGATAVTFGGTAATNVSVFSSTIINATTPAHAAGAVDVVVTTPNGTPTGTAAYTYGAGPTFASIAPTSGPVTGVTNVTITGTNLIGATAVTFGGTAATNVSVFSSTIINATTPAHAGGPVDVVLTTPNGTATGTGAYTFGTAPTVTSITPSTGINTTLLNITHLGGTGFLTGATVNLTQLGAPNLTATNVTLVDATNITCTFDLTGKPAGVYNVTVTNTDGLLGVLTNGFTVTNTTNATIRTGVYRPGAGFYLKKDNGSTWNTTTDQFLGWDNAATDLPLAGDWNTSGQIKTGVYRPGAGFYLKMDNSSTWNTTTDQFLGWDNAATDLPLAGDWNTSGQIKTGVYRPGAGFYLKMDNSSTWNTTTDQFLGWDNAMGDRPIAGDWNSDGRTETGVYRPGAGFYLKMDNTSTWTPSTDVFLGWDNAANDWPVAGDWNGDGRPETGVYRPGAGFYLKMDNGSTWVPSTDVFLPWDNANGDLPIAGNFI